MDPFMMRENNSTIKYIMINLTLLKYWVILKLFQHLKNKFKNLMTILCKMEIFNF